MKMTLDQVKADIASGKVSRIYYAAHSLWWTHLDSDVTESTKIGEEVSERMHSHFMKNIKIPQSEKARRDAMYQSLKNSEYRPPLAVDGSVLFMYEGEELINKWVTEAEKKPEHFGRYGLEAFMKAHHQNCDRIGFKDWEDVSKLIEFSKMNMEDFFKVGKLPAETSPGTYAIPLSKDAFEDSTNHREEVSKTLKQSRNAQCFCGSGKKYKRCCINKSKL